LVSYHRQLFLPGDSTGAHSSLGSQRMSWTNLQAVILLSTLIVTFHTIILQVAEKLAVENGDVVRFHSISIV